MIWPANKGDTSSQRLVPCGTATVGVGNRVELAVGRVGRVVVAGSGAEVGIRPAVTGGSPSLTPPAANSAPTTTTMTIPPTASMSNADDHRRDGAANRCRSRIAPILSMTNCSEPGRLLCRGHRNLCICVLLDPGTDSGAKSKRTYRSASM